MRPPCRDAYGRIARAVLAAGHEEGWIHVYDHHDHVNFTRGGARAPGPTERSGARQSEHDVAVIGAGPVGLAIATELARAGLDVLLVDRRAADDVHVRPQLLVARAGDLANLAHLGVDIHDPWVVTMLATRVERDHASGTMVRGEVDPEVAPAQDLWTLASQPPLALVPIGRLQEVLLARSAALRVTTRHGCHVMRLRRHARFVSLACADGFTALAALVVVATGGARSLIGAVRGFAPPAETTAARMVAGLYAANADRGRWVRVELPVPGNALPARCTFLQTQSAGSGLLVDPQLPANASPAQVAHTFDVAARVHGLDGARCIVPPQVFTTTLSTMHTRFVGLDGRAPIVVAGDAAQTGHVFSGQTCFVNIALALGLCEELRRAGRALVARKIHDAAIAKALGRYNAQSEIGAAILARSSARHYAAHQPGAWALAGVARA